MRRLILTVGLPRSGKSTWARKQGYPIVNPDSVRYAVHGQRFFGPGEPLVWAITYVMAEALFLAGHDTIIIDATNITSANRKTWSQFSNRMGAAQDLHIINTDPGTCIQRAEAENDTEIIPVIKRMAAEWDLPKAWTFIQETL